jgi:hypothetical protein
MPEPFHKLPVRVRERRFASLRQQARVKHFTTFGVAQTEALSATPAATPTEASGLGAGAVAGIVIGALVGTALHSKHRFDPA